MHKEGAATRLTFPATIVGRRGITLVSVYTAMTETVPKGGPGGDNTTATQLLMQGMEELATKDSFQFAQFDGQLPKKWVLLDTSLHKHLLQQSSA
jgi:hypothetical protein